MFFNNNPCSVLVPYLLPNTCVPEHFGKQPQGVFPSLRLGRTSTNDDGDLRSAVGWRGLVKTAQGLCVGMQGGTTSGRGGSNMKRHSSSLLIVFQNVLEAKKIQKAS